jgi:hypothetical protein
MFTVKHTSPTWEDNLYSATGVRFTPAPSVQSVTSPPETVWVRRVDTGIEFPITDGVIYVMNDAGATVAKYDLELKRMPFDMPKAA